MAHRKSDLITARRYCQEAALGGIMQMKTSDPARADRRMARARAFPAGTGDEYPEMTAALLCIERTRRDTEKALGAPIGSSVPVEEEFVTVQPLSDRAKTMFSLNSDEAVTLIATALSRAHIAKKRGEPLSKSTKFEREKLAKQQAHLWRKEASEALIELLIKASHMTVEDL